MSDEKQTEAMRRYVCRDGVTWEHADPYGDLDFRAINGERVALTRRDRIAVAAMTSLVAAESWRDLDAAQIATMAVEQADALIAALAARTKEPHT